MKSNPIQSKDLQRGIAIVKITWLPTSLEMAQQLSSNDRINSCLWKSFFKVSVMAVHARTLVFLSLSCGYMEGIFSV